MSDTRIGQGTQEPSAAEKRARLARLLQEKARGTTALVPDAAASATDHPLAPAQQRLWFLDRLLPPGPLYNLAASVRLRGPLDEDRLDAALTEIARRHETLRTTFHLDEGRPVQRVHPEPLGRLETVDLTTVSASGREAEAGRHSRRAARAAFDLATGPLFRATLLRLGEREHVLVLTMHHVIADGWSVGVALRELVALYASGDPARRSPLPELPIQYADFTHWQLEQLATPAAAAGLDYWTDRLADLPALALPTDRPRGAVPGVAGARRPVEVGPEVTDALKQLGRRHGATLFMTLLATMQMWLARYSGQTDFAVGSPVAGRPRKELEGLIGCFVNVLPLRGDLSGDPTFEEFLRRTRQTALDAFAHQDVPLERVVDALGLERDPGRSPLFQTLFVLQNAPLPSLALPGLDVEARELETGTAKFDLALSLTEADGGLTGCLEYATALFDDATAERMARNFLRLLHAIAADPARRLSELPLTGPDEAKLLARLNETAADFPRDVRIDELIARQAAAKPDALALEEDGRRLTYAELIAAAAQVAEWLREAGVGPGHVVAVAMPRGIDAIVAMLGVMRRGAAYLPLDPRQPPPRLLGMLDDARAAALVVIDDDREASAAFAGIVLVASGGREGQESGVRGQEPEVRGQGSEVRGQDPVLGTRYSVLSTPKGLTLPARLVEMDDRAAYVIFTSGSTGRPKGVLVGHRALANLVAWHRRRYRVTAGDRVSQAVSLAFDGSGVEVWPALAAGASVHVTPAEVLGSPGAWLDWTDRERITLATLPTPLAEACFDLRWPDSLTLRTLVVGGERLRRVPGRGVRAAVSNQYGPTENTVVATECEVGPDEAGPPPIGRPIANVRCHILDARLRPVPLGAPGELYIGGESLALGYLHRAALTAERFIPDPFGSPGARLYKTGDKVRLRSDGQLEFLGRLDRQVKVRGHRVELGEIESALASLDGVAAAAASVRTVGGREQLVGYVVPAEGAALTADDLRGRLAAALPAYMLPARFVVLERLPLTSRGKIDRDALPDPSGERPELNAAFEPPHGEMEERLAALWSEVLGLERVGARDNFFQLGGDSILAIQLVARAAGRGLHFTPMQLFRHQTIAELAPVVAEESAPLADQSPLVGAVPLTPIQHWFLETYGERPHHFNQSLLLEVERGLHGWRLDEALRQLVAHHDALRLRFWRDQDGQWQAECFPARSDTSYDESVLTVVDLSQVPVDRRREAIEEHCRAVQGSLHIEQGPLFRAVYFDLGEQRAGRLLLVAHHLVVDAVSWRILLGDLYQIYAALEAGAPAALPPKTTNLRRWAEVLTDRAAAPETARQAAWWLEQFNEPAPPFPLDHPGGANDAGSAETVHAELSAERTRQLLREAPAAYHTRVQELLLTALARAYRRWSGHGRLPLSLEGHGREPLTDGTDLSRTVGWLTAAYPLMLSAGGLDDIGAAIKTVKEQLRALPDGGIGYGLLRYLRDDETTARLKALPTPALSFNYLGQVDQALDLPDGVLRPADEDQGPEWDPTLTRPHAVDLIAHVAAERLSVALRYSPHRHGRGSVERFAALFVEALDEVVAHCLDPASGGLSPSDFPLAQVSQESLDRIRERFPRMADLYPLTPLQQGMLYHTVAATHHGTAVTQLASELVGPLDREAFAAAWAAVIERHAVLRTAFSWRESERPLQVVSQGGAVRLEWLDWRDCPPAEQQRRFEDLLAADRREGFDLERLPLTRMYLVRTGEAAHRLLWSTHHILLDGWSVPLLLGDLLRLYRAARNGTPAELPEPVPFRRFVEWLASRDDGAAETFWRRTLAGRRRTTPPPAERSGRGPVARYVEHHRRLTAAQTRRVDEFLRRRRLTWNTLLQGAYALALARHTGEDDVLYATTVAGRPAELPGVESIVGLFINTIPVRVRIEPAAPVAAWLEALQERLIEARQHEHAPLFDVRRWSEIPAGQPITENLLVVENYPVDRALQNWSDPDLEMRAQQHVSQSDFPLGLIVTPGEELEAYVAYDESRIDGPAAEALLGHFLHLLTALPEAADDPLAPLGEIDLLDASESRRMIESCAGPARPFPLEASIGELFERQAARTPTAVALSWAGGGLTYAELNARVNRLTRALGRRGVAPGDAVGLCLGRSPEFVIAMLAVLKLGGVYVPVNPLYPAPRRRFMLEDSRARLVIHGGDWDGMYAEVAAAAIGDLLAESEAEDDADPAPVSGGERAAYLIYTSGSTGAPKAVVAVHRGVVNMAFALQEAFAMSPGERMLQFSSVTFDASAGDIFPTLLTGATLCLVDDATVRQSDRLLAALRRERVNVMTVPPTLLATLPPEGLPDLRTVVVAGEACPEAVVRRWGRAVRLINGYGPTENTVGTTTGSADPDEPGPPTIGRPLANVRCYVLDARLRPVPPGALGELYAAGESLAAGYLNRPELTAARFVPDPFGPPGARMYKTGDKVRLRSDGRFEFLGRLDRQVKLRGHRIELGEVEEALANLDAVAAAAASVRTFGGHEQLIGYVVPAAGAALTADDLRGRLGGSLPAFMLPSRFVVLERLPLTSHGKIDRDALPDPGGERPELKAAFEPPHGETEERLAPLWSEVLGLERVGARDNFFHLGGDSIQMLQLLGRVHVRFGGSYSVQQLLENPTVREFAAVIDAGPAAPSETSGPLVAVGTESAERVTTPLATLIAEGQLPPVDSAAVGYLAPSVLGLLGITREALVRHWFGGRAVMSSVLTTPLGSIGLMLLPVLSDELYADPRRLVAATVDALELARTCGARCVSLTGLIPSASDLGRAIVEAAAGRGLPLVTTGHATTAAAVALSAERLLSEAGRDLAGEHVGFLGLGSIGRAALDLMLGRLPHPRALTLCDVAAKAEVLERIERESRAAGFAGPVRRLVSAGPVPEEFGEATLIVGATNMPNVLDVGHLPPGRLIVDDSGPHCFDGETARRRLERDADVLFTEGGVLEAPWPLRQTSYIPAGAERLLPPGALEALIGYHPRRITGCILSSLLAADADAADALPPTIGPVQSGEGAAHLERLKSLGFRGAEPHLENVPLPPEPLAEFRRRFGAR